MNTYTYTARNAKDPQRVLTFTIQGEYLKVNLTGITDNVQDIISGEEEDRSISEKVGDQIQPATLKVLETISGPIHIRDVKINLKGSNGEHLKLTIWKRVGGLRAAPMIVDMGRIDNIEAAEAFRSEVEDRQNRASKVSKFFGPLDYWLGWIGLFVLGLFFIRDD